MTRDVPPTESAGLVTFEVAPTERAACTHCGNMACMGYGCVKPSPPSAVPPEAQEPLDLENYPQPCSVCKAHAGKPCHPNCWDVP